MSNVNGKPIRRVLLVTLASALVATACGSDNGSSSELSGELVISGSSTVEPISTLGAELFAEENPNVALSVDGPGTSDGFELFCDGKTDISDASRAIEPEEQQACKESGIEYIELKIGIDGISVLTSKAFTEVECLDFKDLYALLGPESEGFESWSDANKLGDEIGAAHTPYPDAPLDITAPGEESGTYDSFAELALEDIAYEERGIKEDAPVIRPDYQSSANDNVIIEGLAGNESSLGWVGFAFYRENTDKVRAIAIAEEGNDCVEPSVETIQAGEYPLSRDLYIYVNAEEAKRPEVEAFVDFYLNQLSTLIQETGYVEQQDDAVQEAQQTWKDRDTGARES
jgi:phosphate transport system substrate-binding protein